MAGDFQSNARDFQELLSALKIVPTGNKLALDLGAGHGIQTYALAGQVIRKRLIRRPGMGGGEKHRSSLRLQGGELRRKRGNAGQAASRPWGRR